MKYILIIAALFVTGCATNSDIANLQEQINDVHSHLYAVQEEMAETTRLSEESEMLSRRTYEEFKILNDSVNMKLDHLLKKSFYK